VRAPCRRCFGAWRVFVTDCGHRASRLLLALTCARGRERLRLARDFNGWRRAAIAIGVARAAADSQQQSRKTRLHAPASFGAGRSSSAPAKASLAPLPSRPTSAPAAAAGGGLVAEAQRHRPEWDSRPTLSVANTSARPSGRDAPARRSAVRQSAAPRARSIERPDERPVPADARGESTGRARGWEFEHSLRAFRERKVRSGERGPATSASGPGSPRL
jgi:hypothetical protein